MPKPISSAFAINGVYDYAARYTAGATEYFTPARVPSEIATACVHEAMLAVKGLRSRHVARVDMIVDEDGVPWVLEMNVSPGMSETSLLPIAAQAAGWSPGATVRARAALCGLALAAPFLSCASSLVWARLVTRVSRAPARVPSR